MSYFPIISAPGCLGRTTLFNYPPNDWESVLKNKQLVNLTWAQNDRWNSVTVDELSYGSFKSYQYSDFSTYLPENSLPLLSLSSSPPPISTDLLPISSKKTHIPSWRATIGLTSLNSSASYQGELDPFPVPGSLLTFSPLLQLNESVRNYILLLNLERVPIKRSSKLKIFTSNSPNMLGEFEIFNNCITPISLEQLELGSQDLAVSICTEMSAIPIYLSIAVDGSCLSLEHTHPPASYVLHGRRWEAQRLLKSRWFSRLLPS